MHIICRMVHTGKACMQNLPDAKCCFRAVVLLGNVSWWCCLVECPGVACLGCVSYHVALCLYCGGVLSRLVVVGSHCLRASGNKRRSSNPAG